MQLVVILLLLFNGQLLATGELAKNFGQADDQQQIKYLSVYDIDGVTPKHVAYGPSHLLPTTPADESSRRLAASPWLQLGGDIDGNADEEFGYSVSLSSDGRTMAASGQDSSTLSGVVRVYTLIGTTTTTQWVQKGTDLVGEAVDDRFGNDICLSDSGDVLAVGAPTDDGAGFDRCHVRVFDWDGTNWVPRGASIDGVGNNDHSGMSVSLSGDGSTVAVGAPYNSNVNGLLSGQVRVFEWNGSAWVQIGSDLYGEALFDVSGQGNSITGGGGVSLSIDGSTVAIGAPNNNGNTGKVRVFAFDGTNWNQKGQDIEGEAAQDMSGSAVSLSSDGNTVAIGASSNSDQINLRGHVRVYQWDGTTWVQKGTDIDGEAFQDYSGNSVSLSGDGNTVAIGAHLNDGSGGTNRGHVRVFVWDTTTTDWVQRGIDIDGEADNDESGLTVRLSRDGTTVAIGAKGNDDGGAEGGHVRVYLFPQVVIESEHNYGPNINDVWLVEFPGVDCYTLEMDPQSWTPERQDYVKIFTYDYISGVRVLQTQVTGQRLYKARLLNFGTKQVQGDEGIEVQFFTDNGGGAWGFRLTISACPA